MVKREGFRTFSSESVSDGHPDKLADQISDAILDAVLDQDPYGRVSCEVLVSNQFVVIAGEISSHAEVDYESIARQVVIDVGYVSDEMGLDGHRCKVIVGMNSQSLDIAQGVRKQGWDKEIGAGDQGLMFGYACDETPQLMPAPIYYAHQLLQKLRQQRTTKQGSWIRPDAKSQVTVAYQNGVMDHVSCVVLSTQHDPHMSLSQIKEYVIEEVIKPTIPADYLTHTTYLINPNGRFVAGGPGSDTGLTGRKIIVDTYGGWGAHGGGAFSGKDPTKVDRSAAYMGRYMAKNIVASGLARRCLIQLTYAIGVSDPVSLWLNTEGTGQVSDDKIMRAVSSVFSLRPQDIIRTLELRKPIYRATATYGHFGRDQFRWESTDQIQAFQKLV